MDDQPPIIDGEGHQSMDFTHVSYVVQANILAMQSGAYNEVFNVGTGVSTTVSELASILISALQTKVEPQFSGKPSLVSRRQADISKARQLLGFEPRMEVTCGLTQVAQAIAAHPERY